MEKLPNSAFERTKSQQCWRLLSVGEFGNQSHEEATLWSGGREMLPRVGVKAVLAHFRDQAGLDLGDRPIDVELERYRGEDAAEKWAAASSLGSGLSK